MTDITLETIEKWENDGADEACDELFDELQGAFKMPPDFWPRVARLTLYQRHVIASQVEWGLAQFSRLLRVGQFEGSSDVGDEGTLSCVFGLMAYLRGFAQFLPPELQTVREMFEESADRWDEGLRAVAGDS